MILTTHLMQNESFLFITSHGMYVPPPHTQFVLFLLKIHQQMTTKTDSPPLTSIVLVTLLEIGDDYGSCSSAITTALRAKVKLSFVDESFLILKKKCEIFT
jgi:hypothetical protein